MPCRYVVVAVTVSDTHLGAREGVLFSDDCLVAAYVPYTCPKPHSRQANLTISATDTPSLICIRRWCP
ncbi:MAG: hypothetical protein IKF78_08930 [Atopobiaceae bacterium]|nr:hypothetical protein [Atopobiaceae bacterium]